MNDNKKKEQEDHGYWYETEDSAKCEGECYQDTIKRLEAEMEPNPFNDPRMLVYLVTALLIVLKACGFVTGLSWWWVTIAIWLPFAVSAAIVGGCVLLLAAVAVIVFVIFIGIEIADHFEDKQGKKENKENE